MEKIDEYRMPRRVLMAEVSGGWVRGRKRLGWMDGVKVACVSILDSSERVESPDTYETE